MFKLILVSCLACLSFAAPVDPNGGKNIGAVKQDKLLTVPVQKDKQPVDPGHQDKLLTDINKSKLENIVKEQDKKKDEQQVLLGGEQNKPKPDREHQKQDEAQLGKEQQNLLGGKPDVHTQVIDPQRQNQEQQQLLDGEQDQHNEHEDRDREDREHRNREDEDREGEHRGHHQREHEDREHEDRDDRHRDHQNREHVHRGYIPERQHQREEYEDEEEPHHHHHHQHQHHYPQQQGGLFGGFNPLGLAQKGFQDSLDFGLGFGKQLSGLLGQNGLGRLGDEANNWAGQAGRLGRNGFGQDQGLFRQGNGGNQGRQGRQRELLGNDEVRARLV